MKYLIGLLLAPWLVITLLAPLQGQEAQLYRTDSLAMESLHFPYPVMVDLHLPAHFDEERNRSYPLIILFDSYNQFTHNQNLSSIEMLTYHAQIPTSVVVGVPFNARDRWYYTSGDQKKTADSLTGLDHTDAFVFQELIPLLRNTYHATGPLILLGHSRSGFLTAALMLRHAQEVDAIGSFSAFTEPGFSLDLLPSFLLEVAQRKHPLHFYMTAGERNPEEEGYLQSLQKVADYLQQENTLHLQWSLTTFPYAGHMANYNFSTPHVLLDYFGVYSQWLLDWLFVKLDQVAEGQALEEFMKDEKALQQHYGGVIQADIVHYISLVNQCSQNKRWKDAIDIANRGLQYFPQEWELRYLKAYVLFEMASAEADAYLSGCLKDLQNIQESQASVAAEWLPYFLELQE